MQMSVESFKDNFWMDILPFFKDPITQESVLLCIDRVIDGGEPPIISLIFSEYYKFLFDKDIYSKYKDRINRILASIFNRTYSQNILLYFTIFN